MRHNIYIREENEEFWQAIPSKERSTFVNTMLVRSVTHAGGKKPGVMTSIPKNDIVGAPTNDPDICKHNAIKGFCKMGCK